MASTPMSFFCKDLQPIGLSSVVDDMGKELKTQIEPVKKESLDLAEQKKVSHLQFAEELDFQTDPKIYLVESKKAFNIFLSGLDEEMNFEKMVPHNPSMFPHQMGKFVDVRRLQVA